MAIEIIKGNIFTTKCQTLVNTVNCVGVMGAGIALECRLRYPVMFDRYVALCDEKRLKPGLLWLYRKSTPWILNFPTKLHWKDDSKLEYLHSGLEKFVNTYRQQGIESIAFPLLGADRGGINPEVSERIMLDHLNSVSIPVEIYRYDPSAADDVFISFKEKIMSLGLDECVKKTGIRAQYVKLLMDAVQRPDICQVNQLLKIKGVGVSTVEKVFRTIDDQINSTSNNLSLFD